MLLRCRTGVGALVAEAVVSACVSGRICLVSGDLSPCRGASVSSECPDALTSGTIVGGDKPCHNCFTFIFDVYVESHTRRVAIVAYP